MSRVKIDLDDMEEQDLAKYVERLEEYARADIVYQNQLFDNDVEADRQAAGIENRLLLTGNDSDEGDTLDI